MPRANRYYLPQTIWHITHRCHKKEFLLKFERDRRRWRYWVFEAKKRFGLCVLNYVATSNHIHLLVKGKTETDISSSMQLIAGRTAQEYNRRKHRKGAFWEDRYHATAIDSDTHLARCITYIDLNMVRACAVSNPAEWKICGYNEIQAPPTRYKVIDPDQLVRLSNVANLAELQSVCRQRVYKDISEKRLDRQPIWSTPVAVGSDEFIDRIKARLGARVRYRKKHRKGVDTMLKETDESCY